MSPGGNINNKNQSKDIQNSKRSLHLVKKTFQECLHARINISGTVNQYSFYIYDTTLFIYYSFKVFYSRVLIKHLVCCEMQPSCHGLTGLSRAQGRKSCPQGNLRELSTADLPFEVQDGPKYLQELGLGRQDRWKKMGAAITVE